MRSNKQWRVQQLLRLAELCDTGQLEQRRMYMELVEELLLDNELSEESSYTMEELEEGRFPSVVSFIEQASVDGYSFHHKGVREVYEKYESYCLVKGFKKESMTAFGKFLRSKLKLGYHTKRLASHDNKPVRVYEVQ